MAKFLSAEWLGELERALADSGPLASDERLALGQLVTGTPSGDVSYTLLVGGNAPSEVRTGTADAAVTLVEAYETAVAIAKGAPTADLLSAGSVKVRGDAGALLRAQELLATVAPALAPLAEATEY